MSAQVYSVPGQTEGRKKAFLEWVGGNVDYYKVFIILFLLEEIGNKLAIFKRNQRALISIKCPNWRGEEDLFWGVQEEGPHYEITPKSTFVIRNEKVSPFVKFEIILPLLCFLLDPLTNKHCRTWSSMINLWIDSRTCQK